MVTRTTRMQQQHLTMPTNLKDKDKAKFKEILEESLTP
jgi:hypothetical protein